MEDQEGRRRQSSNFLDILNDPIKYQEQVRNFAFVCGAYAFVEFVVSSEKSGYQKYES